MATFSSLGSANSAKTLYTAVALVHRKQKWVANAKFYHSLHAWADWSLKCGHSTTEHYSHATCIWSNAIPNDNLFDWTHKSPWLFVGHFNIWNTGSLQKIKLNLHLESTAEYSSGQSLYGQLSEAHVSMSTVMSWAQQTTTKVPPSCCPGLPTTWNDVSWTLST